MTQNTAIKLISPTDAPEAIFNWSNVPKSNWKEDQNEQNELVDIIKWVTNDVEELSQNSSFVYALKNVDASSFESVSNLCNLYNRLIVQIRENWKLNNITPNFLNKKALIPHLKFIISQCYNRSVSDPEKLNQYPPFSAQVYGETSFELVLEILKCVEINKKDSFIDLGSGVGQVVIQVAAISDATMCIGIEKAEYPAQCASLLDKEFRRWMAFYGKRYQPYSLERNDFLAPVAHEKIISSSIIFANNFAFGPEVDHQLKERFQNLREGARIVSSKEFCPLNFRITDRNLGGMLHIHPFFTFCSDIGSIMKVECLDAVENAVSWTDKPFSYFLHTIDRSFVRINFSPFTC
ncbi:Histone-lysine N-methyltransferase, H3 lysine-79 specific [Cichlidogyrus casuarinus]|uniref:Histone-lysine N-methyltransferase, H3 lysine-79 specific n=1 Tax=Cichlidogyrus casuarinus TaxID=1844966 RepID=A0ABD2Q791_9PLAT